MNFKKILSCKVGLLFRYILFYIYPTEVVSDHNHQLRENNQLMQTSTDIKFYKGMPSITSEVLHFFFNSHNLSQVVYIACQGNRNNRIRKRQGHLNFNLACPVFRYFTVLLSQYFALFKLSILSLLDLKYFTKEEYFKGSFQFFQVSCIYNNPVLLPQDIRVYVLLIIFTCYF